jgi:hypothetical protein
MKAAFEMGAVKGERRPVQVQPADQRAELA